MERLPQLTSARPHNSSLKPCAVKRLVPTPRLCKATKMGCTSCFGASQVGRAVRRRERGKRRTGELIQLVTRELCKQEVLDENVQSPHQTACHSRVRKPRVLVTRWEAGTGDSPETGGQTSLTAEEERPHLRRGEGRPAPLTLTRPLTHTCLKDEGP